MNKQNKTNTENICKAEWTVLDAQPIPNGREIQKAGQFKTVGSGVISEEEKRERRAAGALDVGVTKVECVSVSGDTLPAEFALTYRFHLENFSETDLDKVPVTIYFNTPDHAPVEQGRTTVTGIKAGHYQLVQFTFPPVKAGKWTMTLEANQPRAFEESNYANNACAKTFSYVNRAELVADKVKALADNPQYDSDGNQILFYDMETVLEFTMSNIGSQAANGVLLQVPAAFQDATGSYSSMLTEGKMDLPVHTQRKAQLKITFTKPATAQIGLLLNNDKGCQEISYDNNETHETFSIMKYNPGTGPDPEPDGEQKLVYPFKTQYYTVGYKDDAPAYEKNFSYGPHYANDFYAGKVDPEDENSQVDLNVYASGYGEIVGYDEFNGLGNVLAVKYTDVLDRNGRNIGAVILRYCHLASVERKSGWVTPGEHIATQGASGAGAGHGARPHLHFEVDRSIDNPLSTPTEGGGVDTTIDPLDILYKKADQIVEPDTAVGGSAVDENNEPWYNVSKIGAIPVV